MGSILSCCRQDHTKNAIDATARHKKTDSHTPKDIVGEKSEDRVIQNGTDGSHDLEPESHDPKAGSSDQEPKSHDQKAGSPEQEPESHDQDEASPIANGTAVNESEVREETNENSASTDEQALNGQQEINTQDEQEINPKQNQETVSLNKEEQAANNYQTNPISQDGVTAHEQEQNDTDAPSNVQPMQDLDSDLPTALVNGDQELEDATEEQNEPLTEQAMNGNIDEHEMNADSVEDESSEKKWKFPPILDEFDLMETDTDPAELEAIFADERLREIYLTVTPEGPGLGISIVGGQGSPTGDLPIIIKRILPDSLAEKCEELKSGDELIAMNDKILIGVPKDSAKEALSNLEGRIRLLVLQDD